jgi:hypothetical protein
MNLQHLPSLKCTHLQTKASNNYKLISIQFNEQHLSITSLMHVLFTRTLSDMILKVHTFIML